MENNSIDPNAVRMYWTVYVDGIDTGLTWPASMDGAYEYAHKRADRFREAYPDAKVKVGTTIHVLLPEDLEF